MKRTCVSLGLGLILLAGCANSATTTSPSAADSTTAPAASAPATTAAKPTSATPTAAAALTAAQVGEKLKAGVPTVTKLTQITEDNDPNHLFGRPNGYVDAMVINDEGGDCDSLGADCGATIEVFPTADGAKARSEYLQAIFKSAPAFGSEYHYMQGPVLLRVSGKLKPSVAAQYEKAFQG